MLVQQTTYEEFDQLLVGYKFKEYLSGVSIFYNYNCDPAKFYEAVL
jgi:hypothetical protein